jgi:PAS domain S-box-containing protein
VLGELESTIAMVGKLKSGPRAGEAERPGGADAERRLLRAVFQVVPAPIFLLERDGAVRRVNRQAATVLGVQPGPATGKPFTAFAALQDRRAVRTQLTAVLCTGRSRLLRCRLAGTTGKVETITFHNSVIRKGAAPDGVLHRRTRGACHDH